MVLALGGDAAAAALHRIHCECEARVARRAVYADDVAQTIAGEWRVPSTREKVQ